MVAFRCVHQTWKKKCNVFGLGGPGWLWGGCSANVDFGEKISKQYVDSQETGQDPRAAVNLHNNAAGRLVSWFHIRIPHLSFQLLLGHWSSEFQQAVKATMRRICRCHGMSQSCSVKTCWTQLSDFREIGNYLKIKHSQAQRLNIDRKHMRAGNSAVSQGAIVDALGSIARTELIYLEESPDYCRRNVSMGLYGTEGRECVQHKEGSTQWERRSCRRLCHDCGLRVEEKRTEVLSSCNCKFHWCCTVNCDDCKRVVVKHACVRRHSADSHGYSNSVSK